MQGATLGGGKSLSRAVRVYWQVWKLAIQVGLANAATKGRADQRGLAGKRQREKKCTRACICWRREGRKGCLGEGD